MIPHLKTDNPNWSGLNVKVKLPPALNRIHPIFHSDRLRLYVDPVSIFKDRPVLPRPPPQIDPTTGEKKFEVAAILAKRQRKNKTEYLCQWSGYALDDTDWVGYFPGDKSWDEDLHIIKAYEEAIAGANRLQTRPTGPPKRGIPDKPPPRKRTKLSSKQDAVPKVTLKTPEILAKVRPESREGVNGVSTDRASRAARRAYIKLFTLEGPKAIDTRWPLYEHVGSTRLAMETFVISPLI